MKFRKIAASFLCCAMFVALAAVSATAAGTGWECRPGNDWVYHTQDGSRKTGWLRDNGSWYYFDAEGVMQRGWQKIGGVWYYFVSSGEMQTGWREIDGKWYLFDSAGAMQTGLVHDGQAWYYLDEDGAWTEDDPESHTAVSATGKTMELRDGMLYVDGLLIANKSAPLPADYAPGQLTAETMAAFERLRQAMQAEGLSLWIASGYRSYSYQQGLYNRYVNRDGRAAADRYSARAGYSEHQTGLAFDVNQVNDSFANTPQARWLAEHAHEYGFIIRYPQGKEEVTGYQYEPWHLRYLGVETAAAVYESGLCLEEYLGIPSRYIQ